MTKYCYSSYEKLLEEIKEAIKLQEGLTQAKLAYQLGYSTSYFNKILNNKKDIKGIDLWQIIISLGIYERAR